MQKIQGSKQRATAKHHGKKWGPYLSERQWGTVRDDQSENGDAWQNFKPRPGPFPRVIARARTGWPASAMITRSFALLWHCGTVRDPIIKERLFGLTNVEGNHGEDVKEYYYYLDSTPTHSYMKYLYKYPQAAYPYDNIVATNKQRGRTDIFFGI